MDSVVDASFGSLKKGTIAAAKKTLVAAKSLQSHQALVATIPVRQMPQ